MKKLELDLAELRVESFETQAAGRRADGTVHAHNVPYTEARYQNTCNTCAPYAPSCEITCYATCRTCPSVHLCAFTDEPVA